jgi:ABC-2 type transport system ATP-binding protein
MSAIEVRGLTKRFGSHAAVEGVEFAVPAGSVSALVGPNGAGKTTILRLLAGLIRPNSGLALLDGEPADARVSLAGVLGAAIEPARFAPGRRVRDHLQVLARIAEVPSERVDQVLELVGLAGAADVRARALSQGMRKRLALAAALLGRPRVLLLDEPTIGLDQDGVQMTSRILVELAAGGGSALIATHDLESLAPAIGDVIVLDGGRVTARRRFAERVWAGAHANRLSGFTATGL